MNDIFISYSREDRKRVASLAHSLEKAGWSVWWDPKILPGEKFSDIIEEALEASRLVMVVWSECSIRSHWVKTEASEGLKRGVLFPIKIDPVKIPIEFRQIETMDFTNWLGSFPSLEIEKLLQGISKAIHPKEKPSKIFSTKPLSQESIFSQNTWFFWICVIQTLIVAIILLWATFDGRSILLSFLGLLTGLPITLFCRRHSIIHGILFGSSVIFFCLLSVVGIGIFAESADHVKNSLNFKLFGILSSVLILYLGQKTIRDALKRINLSFYI